MQVNTSVQVSYYDYEREKNSTESGDSEIGKDDFLQLFVTQLKYQDPLSPMDNNEFLTQTSQFSSLEQLTSMNQYLEQLAGGNDEKNAQDLLISATSFIGKVVEYEGNEIELTDSGGILSFDLEQTPVATDIYISDQSGKIVAVLKPEITQSGKHTLAWDGTGVDGNQVATGQYYFDVKSYDAEGSEIDASEYSTGYVYAAERDGSTVNLDVNGKSISSDKIVSVTTY